MSPWGLPKSSWQGLARGGGLPQAWAVREWGRQGAGSQVMGRGQGRGREPVMSNRGGSGRLEPPWSG